MADQSTDSECRVASERPPASDSESSTQQRRSITTELLLTVNGICVLILLLFIAHDYRAALAQRLSDKHIALQEEAAILLVAVREIQNRGSEPLQAYVDRVCVRMEEIHSPGHHIVVRFGDHVLQANSHHRASEKLRESVEQAAQSPDHEAVFSDRHLITGVAVDNNLSVLVSEFTDEIEREVVHDGVRRITGAVVLAVVAGVIVNLVLLRVVVRPLNRLVLVADEIGRGQFGTQIGDFRTRELSHVSRAVNRMSQSLAESDQQHKSQLAKARRIQENLLPDRPRLTDARFAAHYAPAEEVAGDFFDARLLSDGSWIVFLADVTGHGIPAAMTATLLKTHLAEACDASTNALDIVLQINQRFTDVTIEGDFATAILVRFCPDRRVLEVVNAGHDAAVLIAEDGTVNEFRSTGLLLGMVQEADWTCHEFSIDTRDRLWLFSDGVTETFDPQGRMFGRQRVRQVIRSTVDKPLEGALQQLNDELSEFRKSAPQLDDTTVVVLEFQ